tara:strand:- start:3496 stop:6099 length:2604 start_codon:yes stop_codon:yes gene_type:complete
VLIGAWWNFLTAPGWLHQLDIDYPPYLDDLLGDFFPLLAADGVFAIRHLPLAPPMTVAFALSRLIDGDSTSAIRFMLMGEAMLAATTMTITVLMVVGNGYKSRLPIYFAAIIAGLFYSLNPWFIARAEHVGLLLGYSLAPILMTLLTMWYRTNQIRFAIATGAVLAVMATSVHYMVAGWFIISFIAIIHVLTHRNTTTLRRVSIAYTAGLATMSILLAYIIVPGMASILHLNTLPSELAAPQNSFVTTANHYLALDAITLASNANWSHHMRPPGIEGWAWTAISLLPLGALLFGILKLRNTRFIGLSLLSIALATALLIQMGGSDLSGRPLFWITDHVPGGRLLREPDKFTGLIGLAWSWGIGTCLISIWTIATKPTHRNNVRRLSVSTIFILVLANISYTPINNFLWNGDNNGQSWLPTEFPSGYELALNHTRSSGTTDKVGVFEVADRQVDWDASRTLKHPLARGTGATNLITQRNSNGHRILSAIGLAEVSQLRPLLHNLGATKLVVASDTAAGKEIKSKIGSVSSLEIETDVASVYSINNVKKQPVKAFSQWIAVTGLTEGQADSASVLLDGPDRPCIQELDIVPSITKHIHPYELTCNKDVVIQPVSNTAAKLAGWEQSGGDISGYSRWIDTLERENLSLFEFDYGVGMTWTKHSSRNPLTLNLAVKESGTIFIRALVGKGSSPLLITLNNTPVYSGDRINSRPVLKWIELGPAATHNKLLIETATADDIAAINAIGFLPKPHNQPRQQDTIFKPPTVSMEEQSVTSDRITVTNAKGPFILEVDRPYHRLWQAKYPGGTANPIPMTYGKTGYVIPAIGDYQITTIFRPQQPFFAGVIITIIGSIVTLLYLTLAMINGDKQRH